MSEIVNAIRSAPPAQARHRRTVIAALAPAWRIILLLLMLKGGTSHRKVRHGGGSGGGPALYGACAMEAQARVRLLARRGPAGFLAQEWENVTTPRVGL